ncbi:MAG: hypothetical protein ACXWLY_22785, partial [Thermoanaerobaculia bacterium]
NRDREGGRYNVAFGAAAFAAAILMRPANPAQSAGPSWAARLRAPTLVPLREGAAAALQR